VVNMVLFLRIINEKIVSIKAIVLVLG